MTMQTNGMNVRRIEYIDVAKGIGILLVALGHNYNLEASVPYVFWFIFSFHVPLFFFLSGFIFNLPPTFVELVKKRFLALMLPFLTTVLLLYFMDAFFTEMGLMVVFRRLVKAVLYAGGYYVEWLQLWFLPALFLVNIFAYVMLKYVGNKYLRWLLLFLGLALSQRLLTSFWPFRLTISGSTYEYSGLPYSLDLILICGFFFLLGSEIKAIDLQKILSNWFLLFVSLLGLLALNYFSSAHLNLFKRVFDSLWVNTAEAILGIIFVLTLSVQVEWYFRRLSSVLTYIGRISLFILIFHWYIQEIWRVKLLGVTSNPAIVIAGSFLASILASILIYEVFIKPNHVVSFLFGRKPPVSSNGVPSQ